MMQRKKLFTQILGLYDGEYEYEFVGSHFFAEICKCYSLFDSHCTLKQIQIRATRYNDDVDSWIISLFSFFKEKEQDLINKNFKIKLLTQKDYTRKQEDILCINII